ncbi:hypothetical protein [Flavobacterium hungaricum]|uniref:Lipoprotein n=1 Tax=Flavobacterium hungaricum TaxID=2082725 RepID=A0ABR9TM55_9FLAO|nr:hypothetical protein [Flavobacterium hungaricum]MBE8726436.1 hypothetical protein [Flavobacterium hungaricum]
MKNQIKLTITLGIILTCFLFSCKKQDGYSDEVYNNPNSGNAAAETPNDSASTNNNAAAPNAQSTAAQATSSGDMNTGSGEAGPITGAESTASGNNETKGTGTGSGPAHSAKDGASYTPSSDPKQNAQKDTVKKSTKRKN